MKLHKLDNRIGEPDYVFFCPGCKCDHGVWIDRLGYDGPKWEFNGNYFKPTFRPSLLISQGDGKVCHSFITEGMIQFLNDTTHELSGKTVEIPEYDV